MSKFKLLAVVLLLVAPGLARAYSVLTHEAIIDAAWNDSIRPVLLARFPGASPQELLKAQAYAYGGCILQDMGYYPFGSKFFSDLLHYVRSGDFLLELVEESQDLNEYAFALGSLAHYTADNLGHSLGVNPSVALVYPKLRAKFGPWVTYEDDPAAHLKVEFGFDVLEVASHEFAPQAYHDFIGFEVSKRLIESTFRKVYGLEMSDVFGSVDLALGSYRRTVSKILPEATKVAWHYNKKKLRQARPGITRKRFVYNLSRSSYEREWGTAYERPGWFARFLAFLFRLVPKFGPFRGLQLKPPTPETARLFMNSFNVAMERYRVVLREVRTGQLQLSNRDFDTGRPTEPNEYHLADETYAKLVRTLAEKRFAAASPGIRENVLAFYGADQASLSKDTANALTALRNWKASHEKSGSVGGIAADVP